VRFGLPTEIPHHLGQPIHLVQTVEVLLTEVFEAQAVGE
jgi:hypothetical protein